MTNSSTRSVARADLSPQVSPTSCRSVTQTVNGSHKSVIQDYSLERDGVGEAHCLRQFHRGRIPVGHLHLPRL
ncbi:hypothetical protein SLA2020_300910 [Shorea laevis]